MNYFDRIPHFALFLGFRYAKCGKHGLLPGDDMADRGLKPWPDGETKNPEINALKKPQKMYKNLKMLQNLDKTQKCPKNVEKNLQKLRKVEKWQKIEIFLFYN